MNEQKIPLTCAPNQSFVCNIILSTGILFMGFKLSYNKIAGYWVATLYNAATGVNYIASLPLVCGGANSQNLLEQFGHLNIGKMYIEKTGNISDDIPNDKTLGTDFIMVWYE